MKCEDCICYEKCKSSKLDFAESADPNHICQYFKNKADYAEIKQLQELLYVIRENMTSITRYVKFERKDHDTLSGFEFVNRHLEYRQLAIKAVDNILNYINGAKMDGGKEE